MQPLHLAANSLWEGKGGRGNVRTWTVFISTWKIGWDFNGTEDQPAAWRSTLGDLQQPVNLSNSRGTQLILNPFGLEISWALVSSWDFQGIFGLVGLEIPKEQPLSQYVLFLHQGMKPRIPEAQEKRGTKLLNLSESSKQIQFSSTFGERSESNLRLPKLIFWYLTQNLLFCSDFVTILS